MYRVFILCCNCIAQQEVKESFDFWGTDESNSIHPAECMQRLLEQVRRHRVNIDGNVCTVMVTTLVLEVLSFLSLSCFDALTK